MFSTFSSTSFGVNEEPLSTKRHVLGLNRILFLFHDRVDKSRLTSFGLDEREVSLGGVSSCRRLFKHWLSSKGLRKWEEQALSSDYVTSWVAAKAFISAVTLHIQHPNPCAFSFTPNSESAVMSFSAFFTLAVCSFAVNVFCNPATVVSNPVEKIVLGEYR